ncbi:MAG TPA: phosphate-starvation-inducible PsiE family protein, partial [Polyangiaceae bacterium]
NRLGRFIKLFERIVVVSLVVMMMLVVALATLELAWIIAKDIVTPPILLLEVDELLEIFGFFLLILIGVELLETIKAYLKDNVIHVEIVLEVALIAVARKVIVLDWSKYDDFTVLSIAALIIALAGASFLKRRARARAQSTASSSQGSDGEPPP